MTKRGSWLVLAVAAALVGCGSSSIQPLEPAVPAPSPVGCAVTASDYDAHLDLLALGYSDGTFEVRSPAPDHILSRGKHRAAVINLALSTDGRRLATVDDMGTLAVSLVETGELKIFSDALPAAAGALVGLAWDESGRRLAVAAGGLIRVVDVESGDDRETHLKESVAAIAFAPGGRELVAAGRHVTFLSLPALETQRQLELPGRSGAESKVADVRFSPDGRLLGVLLFGGVAFLDVASGQLDATYFDKLQPVGLRFADDGRVAVFGRRTLYVGPPVPADIEQAAHPTSGELTDVEFRKDGSLMFVGDSADAELQALLQ